MSVFFAREISGVENLHTGYLDHEHGSTENMAGVVAPKLDSIHIHFLEWINGEQVNVQAYVKILLKGGGGKYLEPNLYVGGGMQILREGNLVYKLGEVDEGTSWHLEMTPPTESKDIAKDLPDES